MSSQNVLTIRGLTVDYGRTRVIDGLDLPAYEPGELVALVGPNGAGKSTLLRAIAGLQTATGSISLGEMDLFGLARVKRADLVTYMPQAMPHGVGFSVFESVLGALEATSRPRGTTDPRARAVETLRRVGILDLALSRLDALSGGQRQLAGLAQVLVRSPRVLLLDEPTSALDLRHQQHVMALVRDIAREDGLIVLIVLHDLALAARWADRVAVLAKGRLVTAGTPYEAITPAMLRRTYGVDAHVERSRRGTLQISIDGLAAAAGDVGP